MAQDRVDAREGLTLVEVIVAMAIMAIVILALLSVLATASRLDAITRERTVATNALREVAESLRAYDFGDLYEAYGPGGIFGSTFRIEELEPTPDSKSGSITFFVNEMDASEQALEFGMPRDLDGDGMSATNDVGTPGNYTLLPVRLSATWTGMAGTTSMDLYLLLADK